MPTGKESQRFGVTSQETGQRDWDFTGRAGCTDPKSKDRQMAKVASLGFSRIGPRRDLKKIIEAYWAGQSSEDDLKHKVRDLRQATTQLQETHGVEILPVNDCALYDHVLEMALALGVLPKRFSALDTASFVQTQFTLARGNKDIPALEMTKWFDTNYHYLVPELEIDQDFKANPDVIIDKIESLQKDGRTLRPVLLGPISFLKLSKCHAKPDDLLNLLPALLLAYQDLLEALAKTGVKWVQMEEPCLSLDLSVAWQEAFRTAYNGLSGRGLKLLLANYFGSFGETFDLVKSLPVQGVHFDLVRGAEDAARLLTPWPHLEVVSFGILDGRNVWRADLSKLLDQLEPLVQAWGTDRVELAPSCSLQFVPVDLSIETDLDSELVSWLAFGVQKLDELALLARAINEGRGAILAALTHSDQVAASRASSLRIFRPDVRRALQGLDTVHESRLSSHSLRQAVQDQRLKLPLFPTTTIGSFPQTKEIRELRVNYRAGRMDAATYEAHLKAKTADCIARQEALDLDVLVHGEFERTDMVEYFGEQLDGFAFTKYGWVQSYGTRCVKPPILFGDVDRKSPMTVDWALYAQGLTSRPVKAMLTGPVTILQWSFVRNDQPRMETCRQIALALRKEVLDLEAAGLAVIQIDEPALREGLPLRREDWAAYLNAAVRCFRLAANGVRNDTQIHTHMCYSEFGDILPSIEALDADVISIETTRSGMELLRDFEQKAYPNDIGPGIWDIHAPRVPSQPEMERLLRKAAAVIPAERLWVNPDCGLKTRNWPEVEACLTHLVGAAKTLRAELGAIPQAPVEARV